MAATLSAELKPITAQGDEILSQIALMRKEIGRLTSGVGALQQEVAALKARREQQSGYEQSREQKRTQKL